MVPAQMESDASGVSGLCGQIWGFRRLTAAGILLWTGFAAGILSVAAVLRMGLCGMLLCIAGIFPQYIFYVPAYLLLIRYYYRYPQSEWNWNKNRIYCYDDRGGNFV